MDVLVHFEHWSSPKDHKSKVFIASLQPMGILCFSNICLSLEVASQEIRFLLRYLRGRPDLIINEIDWITSGGLPKISPILAI